MTLPILAALVLFAIQASLHTSIWFVTSDDPDKGAYGLGPRDRTINLSVQAERAKRAHTNFAESLPAFLALALLHEIHGDLGSAPLAAWGFVAFRVAYVPAYISGIPGIRSMMWLGSGVCLIGMGGMLLT